MQFDEKYIINHQAILILLKEYPRFLNLSSCFCSSLAAVGLSLLWAMFGNLAVEYDLIFGPDGIDPWLKRMTRESMFS